MALNVIEFTDPTGEIVIARVPQEGTGEFVLGSQLIVQENQVAFFYRDGKVLDMFRPGRHTLQTQNLPLLGPLIGLAFGGRSPFRAHVYFLSLQTFRNLGWGTPTPVTFRDSEFRMASLRAHGSFALRIAKPRLFMATMVATQGVETTFALEEYLRRIIVSRFAVVIAKRMKSVLDLPIEYTNIATDLKNDTRQDTDQYGIQLVDLLVEAITVPPEVQEMLNRATGIAAQDIDKYKAVAMADAMREAAKAGGGEGVGAGLGIGAGLGMARVMMEEIKPGASQPPPSATVPVRDIKKELLDLKELLDAGVITKQEFEAKKQELLKRL